jgi:hypothetical protein
VGQPGCRKEAVRRFVPRVAIPAARLGRCVHTHARGEITTFRPLCSRQYDRPWSSSNVRTRGGRARVCNHRVYGSTRSQTLIGTVRTICRPCSRHDGYLTPCDCRRKASRTNPPRRWFLTTNRFDGHDGTGRRPDLSRSPRSRVNSKLTARTCTGMWASTCRAGRRDHRDTA